MPRRGLLGGALVASCLLTWEPVAAQAPAPAATQVEVLRGTAPVLPLTLAEFGQVKFTLWGWFEAATIFRKHDQVNDALTVFNAVPYPNSPLYNEHEFRGTARQSQFSL